MEKRIIAFGASNSKNSINRRLAAFAANQLKGVQTELLDLNDFELPLFSVDLQESNGIPDAALAFLEKIKACDGIVISVAEYNGLHTTAFKNLWDWMSRIENMQIWNKKGMFLLSTSPSRRPDNYVMKVSKELFPSFGANIIADYYLPSFNHFFKGNMITEESYHQKFQIELKKFQTFLSKN